MSFVLIHFITAFINLIICFFDISYYILISIFVNQKRLYVRKKQQKKSPCC
nr:MAG TPA_asm: hypothetical protein [Caudoviricetes sp.]